MQSCKVLLISNRAELKKEFVMKKISRIIIFSIYIIAMVFMGCSSTTNAQCGFLDGYYQNLEPGNKDGAKQRWIKAGINFGKYDKVMLDSVIFYFAKDADYKGIDVNELKDLADYFNTEMVKSLKGAYPIVSKPGPDVLRLRVAITNLKPSRPVLSVISTVIPVGLGISVVKKGVVGEWSGAGEISMEFMGIDSMSNDVIAAGVDERSAEFFQRYTYYGSAKDAFTFWAERIRVLLDLAHQKK